MLTDGMGHGWEGKRKTKDHFTAEQMRMPFTEMQKARKRNRDVEKNRTSKGTRAKNYKMLMKERRNLNRRYTVFMDYKI